MLGNSEFKPVCSSVTAYFLNLKEIKNYLQP